MKTVLIDMDEVIVDYDRGIMEILQEEYPEIPLDKPRLHFKMSEDHSNPDHKKIIKSIPEREHFFLNLPLIPHALDGIQKVIDLGYHPRICSSPLTSNLTCREDKLKWLENNIVPHFGKYIADEAAIVLNKYLIYGIALIDDKPQIKNAEKASWKQIIFNQPYNIHVKTDLRLYGWKDKNLRSLLEGCCSYLS